MAFRIADNKLALNSAWDEQLLSEQFKVLSASELDFDIQITGFELGEIDLFIEGLSPAGQEREDAEATVELASSVAVTTQGDLWLLGRHRVVCGNALDDICLAKLMDGHKAAMVFIDPPYNVRIDGHATGLGVVRHREFPMASGEMTRQQYTDFLFRTFTLLVRNSVAGSIHFVFGDWRHLRELLEAGEGPYGELKNLCVWAKNNGGMGTFYRSQHELVFVFKSGEAPHRNNFQLGQFGRYRTNVWNYPARNSFARKSSEGNLCDAHPTPKPIDLVADAIMDVSARKEIVLDSFLGSGTTVVAAERTGRICHGVELDPLYVDLTVRRWQTFTGLSAVHAVSGRTFTEIEKEASDVQR